jgi:hypothetical protein
MRFISGFVQQKGCSISQIDWFPKNRFKKMEVFCKQLKSEY